MHDALVEAFRQTDYRVRLADGGHASIRIGEPLPSTLQAWVDGAAWGVITAWNPRSNATPTPHNRAAQRHLLADLRALGVTRRIVPAVGVGANGWLERSLFVIGPSAPAFRELCIRYAQHACVVGEADAAARLCWADDAP